MSNLDQPQSRRVLGLSLYRSIVTASFILLGCVSFLATPAQSQFSDTYPFIETLAPALNDDGTAPLVVATGTDILSAGVGLLGDGAGTISLMIPADATVEQVFIYWGGRASEGDQDDTIVVNGTEVEGTLVGLAAQNVRNKAFTYRADITNLNVLSSGIDNVVTLSGFEDPNPTPNDVFREDGASIVAIVNDGTAMSEFQIRDGADMAFRGFAAPADVTVPQEFTFAPEAEARTAKLILMAGDTDTERPDRLTIWVDGAVFLDQFNYFQELAGAQWSNREEFITLPAGATSVSVQLFSEDDDDGIEELPESITWNFAGFVLPLPVDEGPGCTLTQGYWKTHSEFGPAPYDETWALLPNGASTELFGTGESWYDVFHTPPRRGNAYIQLAHQWMAARLNVLAGADDSAVAAEIAEGAALLEEYADLWDEPRDLRRNFRADFDRMGQIARILDDYNNGLIGPGHCDDDSSVAEGPSARSSAQGAFAASVTAFPNPMRDQATLSVTLDESTEVRAAVYDVMGRRVALLTDGVLESGTHQLQFNASDLANGVYVYRVETPTGVETGRLSVIR